MKSYTDLEQSKKLAEILPVETADMYYCNGKYIVLCLWNDDEHDEDDIPAWSLSALFDVLLTLDSRDVVLCKDIRYDKWCIYYHSTPTLSIIDTKGYDNPVDACYQMILELHELKML